jgi:hypothetical protein
MELAGTDGTTSATVITEVQLSGKVATMGQGVRQDVSGRLIGTFAENLAAMVADRLRGPRLLLVALVLGFLLGRGSNRR